MGWLDRRGPLGSPGGGEAGDKAGDGAEARSSPGLRGLFEGVDPDGDHALLDLGPATGRHLTLYRSFARHVCFADLLPDPPRGRAFREALHALRTPEGARYDVVLVWDLLDRIGPDERSDLMERLTALTEPPARLYAVVRGEEVTTASPVRHVMTDPGSVRREPAGPPKPAGPGLLPAQVERILEPWQVGRAFTVRGGLREYLALRR